MLTASVLQHAAWRPFVQPGVYDGDGLQLLLEHAPLPVTRLLQMYKSADRNLRQLREDPATTSWLR
jgi:hypothetical protein